MKRGVIIICVIVAFGFQAFVFSLIWQPKVDEEYRLYYIERALKYWPRPWGHADGLSYPVGEELDFTRHVVYLSRIGWGRPEPEGTRMVGPQAGVLFRWPVYAPVPKSVWTQWSVEVRDTKEALRLNTLWQGQLIDKLELGTETSFFSHCTNLPTPETDGIMRLDFCRDNTTEDKQGPELRIRRLWLSAGPCPPSKKTLP